MNESLQKAVALLIEKSITGVEKAASFLSAEIPDVIYQLLLWKGVISFVYFLVSLVVFSMTIFYSVKLIRQELKKDYPDADVIGPTVIIAMIIGGLSFIGIIHHLAWLQILIAPKIYLIEYAASLIK